MDEFTRILGNLARVENYTTTTDKDTARRLIVTDNVFCNGDLRDIQVKSKGLGVYKISSKQSNPMG